MAKKISNKSGIKDIQQPTESRKANYKLLDVFNKFELGLHKIEGTCGNIQHEVNGKFDLDPKTKKWGAKGGLFGDGENVSFYDVVSAPMLLARLVSAGCAIEVYGQEAYKTTWHVAIKHKETGCIATFYDYKGSASVGTCHAGLKNKKFKKDLFNLLISLVSGDFPHPYDGCVVGEIA